MEIRSITLEDGDAYCSVLMRTTEEDRYCRFFHVVNHFDLSDICRFVDPRPDTFGYIAETRDIVDGERTALGVAHAFDTSPHCAELAIVVARDARHSGVGHALLESLIAELRRRGYRQVTAYALGANGSFSALARSVGMHPAGAPGEIQTWELDLVESVGCV